MSALFDSPAMAAGYARARPPVHPRIVARALQRLGLATPVRRAIDIGCGSGVSTAALASFADYVLGVEPVAAMLEWAPSIAPSAEFAVGSAEALPVESASFDLATAAGSLNFCDCGQALPEIARVLAPGGALLIYDFRQGSDFPDSPLLTDWHREFKTRYPPPPSRPFDPEWLPYAEAGLRIALHEPVEIDVLIAPDFYLNYAMTETNVSLAIQDGVPAAQIRDWCAESLRPVFEGQSRLVLFKGYFVCANTGGRPSDIMPLHA